MIEFDRISVRYDAESVLTDFSAKISAGEKVVFAGPSGAGKSTLFHVLLGFVPLAGGEIQVDGVKLDAGNIGCLRNRMAWLPQELSLGLDTVRELVFYPFGFRGNRERRPSESRVKECFERLLLPSSVLDKRLDEISGGQKQRAALTSVLLLGREIVLLDEPTSALDDASAEAVASWVRELAETTVLSVSHDGRWTERMERRIEIVKSNG